MHHNPAAAQAPAFALPRYRVVALSGRDATAFAQAQFMNDVVALAPGRWQWNGWLTPKGRVIALFALLRIQDDVSWLLLFDNADADADAIAARLRGFVFRSKGILYRRVPRPSTVAATGRSPRATATGKRTAAASTSDPSSRRCLDRALRDP